MGLGYMLLAVNSEQDNYLIGNQQFTFFKWSNVNDIIFVLRISYLNEVTKE